MTQRAVVFDGAIIGYVTPRRQQDGPDSWVERWDLHGEAMYFDGYEDACAYLIERYIGKQGGEST